MKKPISVLPLLLGILLSSFGYLNASDTNPKEEIEFLIANVEDIKTFAANDEKLILLHFTASWCMPCQWMERNTYKNANLAHFVNENYLAKKIDIDDFEGRRLKDHYKVKTLPSILIFNAQGKLLDRINEAIEAKELLNVLEKINATPANKPLVQLQSQVVHEQSYIAAPTINISPQIQMPLIENYSEEEIIQEDPITDVSIPSMDYEEHITEPAPKKEVENYNVRHQSTYGVQIGAFSTRANAHRCMMKHKKQLKESIQIIPEVNGLKTVYKVLVGEFNQELDAQRYKRHLQGIGLQSYVKEIIK